jgi:hypothetical protein
MRQIVTITKEVMNLKRFLTTIGILLLLTACGSTPTSAEKESRFTDFDNNLVITTDKETGCKYIVFYVAGLDRSAGAMTPLLQPNGTPNCNK